MEDADLFASTKIICAAESHIKAPQDVVSEIRIRVLVEKNHLIPFCHPKDGAEVVYEDRAAIHVHEDEVLHRREDIGNSDVFPYGVNEFLGIRH